MTYRVVWKPKAEQELTRIWLASRFRSQIVETASRIDEELRREPLTVGESREDPYRVTFDPPLAIRFLVDEAARLVVVVNLWQTHRFG